MKEKKICIIGGGLSGLIAANRLYEKLGTTVHITLLEKEKKLGGRVVTKTFKNCPIEIGAQFFVDGQEMHKLIQRLHLESDVISLERKFISFHHNNSTCKELDKLDFFNKTSEEETKKLHNFATSMRINEELLSDSFERWYTKHIGSDMLSFWNRLFMSIGVKDVNSINGYFGLILVNVFFGKNYLLRSGMEGIIKKLEQNLASNHTEIITDAECTTIEKRDNEFRVTYLKENQRKELRSDKVIFAGKPTDLESVVDTKIKKYCDSITGHPMTLYVLECNVQLWEKTWGLINIEQQSPVYALCDWRNVMNADKNSPILAICSPYANEDEILAEMHRLFRRYNPTFSIIYKKEWDIGLHQADADFFTIPKVIQEHLPEGLYLAGDWITLPALEGALISGGKAAERAIKGLET